MKILKTNKHKTKTKTKREPFKMLSLVQNVTKKPVFPPFTQFISMHPRHIASGLNMWIRCLRNVFSPLSFTMSLWACQVDKRFYEMTPAVCVSAIVFLLDFNCTYLSLLMERARERDEKNYMGRLDVEQPFECSFWSCLTGLYLMTLFSAMNS